MKNQSTQFFENHADRFEKVSFLFSVICYYSNIFDFVSFSVLVGTVAADLHSHLVEVFFINSLCCWYGFLFSGF